MAYSTVYGFYRLLREGIYRRVAQEEGQLGGEVEADESYFGGGRRGKRVIGVSGKIPVFGIVEREGEVKVEIVKDVRAGFANRNVERNNNLFPALSSCFLEMQVRVRECRGGREYGYEELSYRGVKGG